MAITVTRGSSVGKLEDDTRQLVKLPAVGASLRGANNKDAAFSMLEIRDKEKDVQIQYSFP